MSPESSPSQTMKIHEYPSRLDYTLENTTFRTITCTGINSIGLQWAYSFFFVFFFFASTCTFCSLPIYSDAIIPCFWFVGGNADRQEERYITVVIIYIFQFYTFIRKSSNIPLISNPIVLHQQFVDTLVAQNSKRMKLREYYLTCE